MFVITPDGTIARHFQAISPSPAELAAALRRAASGAPVVAESIAERVLSCFRFDPAERAHRALIDRYLQIGGGLVVLAVVSLVAGLLVRERVRRRRR
jgi:hypothetical protein